MFVPIETLTKRAASQAASFTPNLVKGTMIPIIKVVGDFCNLKCTYCFYNQRDQLSPHVMSSWLLEKFIKEYLQMFQGDVRFIWHGGEPLLAGIDFFQSVVRLQKVYADLSHQIKNTIQTNATLINDEWAEFFAHHQFGVGVSLDGSAESHNRFRKNTGGHDTFTAVRRGIEILREHGLRPGFIQTLTKSNLERTDEDFHFFSEILGAENWGINHFLGVNEINKSMRDQSITDGELSQFFKRYIDLWLEQDDSKLRIREIDNFLAGVVGKRPRNCTFNGTCTSYFCLEYDGRVYPCDRLSGRNDLLYGDLLRQSLQEILTSPTRQYYVREVNKVHPDCAVCEWQLVCHNGCTHHRKGGISGKYYYCETRKFVFAYLRQKVSEYKNSPEEVL